MNIGYAGLFMIIRHSFLMQHGNVGFLHNAWSSDDNVIIECRQEITNLL